MCLYCVYIILRYNVISISISIIINIILPGFQTRTLVIFGDLVIPISNCPGIFSSSNRRQTNQPWSSTQHDALICCPSFCSSCWLQATMQVRALPQLLCWHKLCERDWQVGKRKPAFYIILHRYAGVPMHEGYFLLANLINKSNYCRCRSSSFKLCFDQSTKPFASFGLRVPVISVARAMALTGVVKSFNPHKAARWCHSDPRWMPCECRECWMLTFIICFSVRVGFFVCHVPGETHKLMVSNGTCLDAAGMGFHWEQWARCFPLQGRSERNLRGQRYECAIHHEIVPQTWNVLERMLNCCFMLFYVVFCFSGCSQILFLCSF